MKARTGVRRYGAARWLGIATLFLASLLTGCGDDVTKEQITQVIGDTPIEEASKVEPEQCLICHEDQGQKHQDIYNDYKDTSDLVLTLDSVDATGAGPYDLTLNFHIDYMGSPYIGEDGLTSLDQKTFYSQVYDSATGEFLSTGSGGEDQNISFGNIVSNGDGTFTATASASDFDPNTSNAIVYGYIADGLLDTESAGHVHMYDDVSNAALAFGDADTYDSPANVSACETCHGKPYMKHGYRAGVIAGVGDFSGCKNCHYDDRGGHVETWQVLVDDPVCYAEIAETGDDSCKGTRDYSYTANLMNDVHMSHSMEFPYPQSMKNCNTCHAGKMAEVTDPSNFRLEVCKSCHAREGGVNATGTVDTTEYSLVTLSTANFDSHPDLSHANAAADTIVCTNCHEGATAPTFSQIHGGYDSEIYMADGTRYSDTFSASIDAASVSDNVVTFSFSATESPDVDASPMNVSDIAPIVMVGLYGYDTKDFIVYTHDRFDSNGDGVVDRSDKSQLEYTVGDTDHPNFTTTSNPGDGTWEVTVDLSTWADMITDGAIKRIELAVRPALKVDVAPLVGDTESVTVALDAPSRTFDLAANDFDDDFYDDIVNVATVTQADGSLSGCNTCHDALATTFHSADRGGNIKVCRMCHATLAGGSHLELQSRSIDSYVHAVHSFAPFDPGDVDLEDPVEYELYTLHREHTFPNFTIKNCEACHVAGGRFTNPPEQGSSLPGILSGTDNVDGRGLGDIESVVTGPGARACGACHRQHALNEGDDEKLIAVNAHTTLHGYALPDEDGVLDAVIDHIMSLFN